MSDANLAILLVTANFLSSDFIQTREVPELLERQQKNAGLSIYPILAKDCAWQLVPWLERKQMRPDDGKAVWRDGGRYVDRELKLITLEIDATLKLTRQAKQQAAQGLRSEAQASLAKLASVGEVVADGRKRILAQMEADAQKQKKERWKILQETQAKIFAIQQDVSREQQSSRDRMFNKWQEYLKS